MALAAELASVERGAAAAAAAASSAVAEMRLVADTAGEVATLREEVLEHRRSLADAAAREERLVGQLHSLGGRAHHPPHDTGGCGAIVAAAAARVYGEAARAGGAAGRAEGGGGAAEAEEGGATSLHRVEEEVARCGGGAGQAGGAGGGAEGGRGTADSLGCFAAAAATAGPDGRVRGHGEEPSDVAPPLHLRAAAQGRLAAAVGAPSPHAALQESRDRRVHSSQAKISVDVVGSWACGPNGDASAEEGSETVPRRFREGDASEGCVGGGGGPLKPASGADASLPHSAAAASAAAPPSALEFDEPRNSGWTRVATPAASGGGFLYVNNETGAAQVTPPPRRPPPSGEHAVRIVRRLMQSDELAVLLGAASDAFYRWRRVALTAPPLAPPLAPPSAPRGSPPPPGRA
ncbi:hypothetical protein EMIHUDRAFT_451368, partial [Emiliania huxleyi CCMP1516]|uniref:WW domain-containing protein n=2 Tax=Emiliania huxleyi TaxID=2903 RepID=A0A0D3J1F5_EMIH1